MIARLNYTQKFGQLLKPTVTKMNLKCVAFSDMYVIVKI
jgi:hypothetical protein